MKISYPQCWFLSSYALYLYTIRLVCAIISCYYSVAEDFLRKGRYPLTRHAHKVFSTGTVDSNNKKVVDMPLHLHYWHLKVANRHFVWNFSELKSKLSFRTITLSEHSTGSSPTRRRRRVTPSQTWLTQSPTTTLSPTQTLTATPRCPQTETRRAPGSKTDQDVSGCDVTDCGYPFCLDFIDLHLKVH